MGLMPKFVSPVAVLAAAVLLLTGCSGGNAGDGRPCETVPPELLSAIADGANDGPAITPVAAGAVKSAERGDVYIVAMSFTTPGFEDEHEVGVWGIGGSLTPGSGPLVAIDSFAAEFTVWPHQMNGEEFSVAEDGVDEAKACLEG
ncbi:Lipoprotein [Plantibacter sp. RU18]